MPDSNLKAAMEEIKVILKKYDCAAAVTLASPTHSEFLYEVAPSWSCAWLERIPGDDKAFGIRFRSKLVDYPSKAAQKKVQEDTAGMFLTFANQAERTAKQMTQLMLRLAMHFKDISHWEREE